MTVRLQNPVMSPLSGCSFHPGKSAELLQGLGGFEGEQELSQLRRPSRRTLLGVAVSMELASALCDESERDARRPSIPVCNGSAVHVKLHVEENPVTIPLSQSPVVWPDATVSTFCENWRIEIADMAAIRFAFARVAFCALVFSPVLLAQRAIDDRSRDQTAPISSAQVTFYQVADLPPGTTEGTTTVRVFYATNRAVKGAGPPRQRITQVLPYRTRCLARD